MSRLDEPRPLERPSLEQAITVLLRVDDRFDIHPTPEEIDAGEAIRHINGIHQGSRTCDNPTEPDPFNRTWGSCSGCGERWPCPPWNDAQALAVLYAGRAHNRYRQRAAAVLERARAGKSGVAS